MKAIVNVNNEWGIGKDNKLLCSFPEDLKRFRDITNNKIIVYGRKTLLSLPNLRPLPNRVNIVLSSSNNIPDISKSSCDYYLNVTPTEYGNISNIIDNQAYKTILIVANDISVIKDINRIFKHKTDDIIVCGGESIYKQLIPDCDTIYVTKNNYQSQSDTFFPNLDILPEWYICSRSGILHSTSGIDYEFLEYCQKI